MLDVSQHSLPAEMSKTPKKIYMQRLVTQQVLAGSGSLWGILLNRKNLFGKANRALLVAAEEIYGISLQRRELLPHLICRPCERRLKNFVAFKIMILEI